jgi:hypothetical protein
VKRNREIRMITTTNHEHEFERAIERNEALSFLAAAAYS